MFFQLSKMEYQKRESITRGAAEIILQMIKVKNHEQSGSGLQSELHYFLTNQMLNFYWLSYDSYDMRFGPCLVGTEI